jgi:hypothetical protein
MPRHVVITLVTPTLLTLLTLYEEYEEVTRLGGEEVRR